MKKNLNIFLLPILLSAILFLVSCKKLIEVEAPSNTTNQENVYNNEQNSIAVLTAIYMQMSQANMMLTPLTGISLQTGLSSDELVLAGAADERIRPFYTNSLTAQNVAGYDFWKNIYTVVFTANSAIEGLTTSTKIKQQVRDQLLGEAKFIRAFCFFYLVNLYGDVPLITSTDYKVNSQLKRSDKSVVYEQILADLKDAQTLLSKNYVDKTLQAVSPERVRPISWAATALLSRTYLFLKDWNNASIQASIVIDHTELFHLVSQDSVFLMNNAEAIWQLQPVAYGRNTQDAWLYILPAGGPDRNHPVYLSNFLLNSFEENDSRKYNWIDSVVKNNDTFYYAAKYKSAKLNNPVTEYSTLLRLSELHLIRAEARVWLNNIDGAREDLNKIRSRAGLTPVNTTDKDTLLTTILHERQVELFTEWGHRWFDLKRTGYIDKVMSAATSLKGGSWNTNWQLYPISQAERELNPAIKQNQGY